MILMEISSKEGGTWVWLQEGKGEIGFVSAEYPARRGGNSKASSLVGRTPGDFLTSGSFGTHTRCPSCRHRFGASVVVSLPVRTPALRVVGAAHNADDGNK